MRAGNVARSCSDPRVERNKPYMQDNRIVSRNALFDELVRDACELVKRAAHPKRRTVWVSPEVAAMLEKVPRRAPTAVAPERVPQGNGELATLEKVVSGCTRCPLSATRTQAVFGDGNPRAALVFVGEAPGEEEDRQGLPFVGRAGKLLTDIIEKGMKLKRSDVYICNVLKCRPPGNREPRLDEIEQCEPYLARQLDLIRPKVICALGAHAAHTLLKNMAPTGRLRGRWHFYRGVPLRVTYHPAYLLRNPADKRKTWDDIQHVMKVLSGEETPIPDSEGPLPSREPDLFA